MKAEYKIPGGKLIACTVEQIDGVITELQISGDFFMHPEDAIMELEKTILGSNIRDYPAKIRDFIEQNKIILYGVSPDDFAAVIRLALDSQ